jgi:hypothetical protein
MIGSKWFSCLFVCSESGAKIGELCSFFLNLYQVGSVSLNVNISEFALTMDDSWCHQLGNIISPVSNIRLRSDEDCGISTHTIAITGTDNLMTIDSDTCAAIDIYFNCTIRSTQ